MGRFRKTEGGACSLRGAGPSTHRISGDRLASATRDRSAIRRRQIKFSRSASTPLRQRHENVLTARSQTSRARPAYELREPKNTR